MKFKGLKNFKIVRALTVALVAIGMVSCGKSSEMAEQIPGNAQLVMKLNLAQVVENAGCSIDDGVIELSDELMDAVAQHASKSMVKQVLKFTKGFNLAEAYIYSTDLGNGNSVVFLGSFVDKDDAIKTLNTYLGKPQDMGDFQIYKTDGPVIAIKGNYMWVSDKLAIIDRDVEAASKEKLDGKVLEYISQDKAFAVAVSLSALRKEMGNELPAMLANGWALGSTGVKGKTWSGELYFIDGDGAKIEIGDSFENIDPSFLDEMPADATQFIAVGNPTGALRTLINRALEDEGRAEKLLTGIDGTCAFGLDSSGLSDKLRDIALQSARGKNIMDEIFNDIKFVVIAHMPKASSEALTQNILENATDMKVNNYNGIYSVDANGVDIFFGPKNEYFGIANFNFGTAKGASKYASQFRDRKVVFYSDQPAIPAYRNLGIEFGGESVMWLDNTSINFECTLKDTDDTFMEAIIHTALNPKFQEFIREYIKAAEERWNSYYYYDYDDDYYGWEEAPVAVADSIAW